MQRRDVLLGALAAGISAACKAGATPSTGTETLPEGAPGPVENIDLWPGGAPGAPLQPLTETVTERSVDVKIQDRAVTGIFRPRMTVFRPQVPNGAALLIIPGGGYERVVFDKEGYVCGRWFAARGFTVFVLFYRLPGEGWAAGPDVALSDAQRAIRIIRHRAKDYGVDAERIAVMGFSAGGHLCADLATRFAVPTYDPLDPADTLSARPLLAAPMYPVISMTAPLAHAGSRALLIGTNAGPELERAHSPQHNVPADAPAFFLVHAEDDDVVPVGNTLEFRAALRARDIPVEMHLFTQGGHGFGLRGAIGKPVEAWPGLFVSWSQSMGLMHAADEA